MSDDLFAQDEPVAVFASSSTGVRFGVTSADPRPQWDEFIAAVEKTVAGDLNACADYFDRYPRNTSEFIAFVAAIREGRLVKTPIGYRAPRRSV